MSPYDPLKHGPKRIVGPGFHEQVHKLVGTVPPGSVTTYGDIGAALGSSTVARHVGYAMAALPALPLPSTAIFLPLYRSDVIIMKRILLGVDASQ